MSKLHISLRFSEAEWKIIDSHCAKLSFTSFVAQRLGSKIASLPCAPYADNKVTRDIDLPEDFRIPLECMSSNRGMTKSEYVTKYILLPLLLPDILEAKVIEAKEFLK